MLRENRHSHDARRNMMANMPGIADARMESRASGMGSIMALQMPNGKGIAAYARQG
jgi:hypothetical protein